MENLGGYSTPPDFHSISDFSDKPSLYLKLKYGINIVVKDLILWIQSSPIFFYLAFHFLNTQILSLCLSVNTLVWKLVYTPTLNVQNVPQYFWNELGIIFTIA